MTSRPLTPCAPDEVPRLLPEVLAGRMVLAPAVDERALENLRRDPAVCEVGAGLVVSTSGSSGVPKQVVLSSGALLAAARAAEQVSGPLAWTNVLPTHYVAGAMVHVRALVAGRPAHDASPHLDDLGGIDGGAISIVPTQLHRAMADERTLAALARFELVLLGGAAVDAGLLSRARAAGVRLVTTYGMSETAGGCVWDGQPLPGVEVRIDEDQRIWLGGPMVFTGYRGAPELTAEVLRDGFVRTNDRGRWVEGRLEVLGRLDDVVISGGVNVDLAAVRRAVDGLVAREGLAPATVVGLPDAEWGQRVCLVTGPSAPGLDWWQGELRPGLDAAALPRRLELLDALPLTSSGKIDPRAIVARLS